MFAWTIAVLMSAGADEPKQPAKPRPAAKEPSKDEASRLMFVASSCEKCHSQPLTKCPGGDAALVHYLMAVNVAPAAGPEKSLAEIATLHTQDDVRTESSSWATTLTAERFAFLLACPDGWRTEPATGTLRAQLGLSADVGLVVAHVGDNAPAAKAGVKKDDVLVTIDGRELKSNDDLDRTLKEAMGEIECVYFRAGKRGSLKLTADCKREADGGAVYNLTPEPSPPRIGLSIAAVDDAIRAQVPELRGKGGVIVTAVSENGPAAEAGLKVHDIVEKLLQSDVGSEAEFRKIIEANENRQVEVEYIRAGKRAATKVTPRRAAKLQWRASVEYKLAPRPAAVYLGAKHDSFDPRTEIAVLQADLARMQERLQKLSKSLAETTQRNQQTPAKK
jgi:membrane-associated protease RseP (regulator of RpoE activity)